MSFLPRRQLSELIHCAAIADKEAQSCILATLRDTLQPKLLSGGGAWPR